MRSKNTSGKNARDVTKPHSSICSGELLRTMVICAEPHACKLVNEVSIQNLKFQMTLKCSDPVGNSSKENFGSGVAGTVVHLFFGRGQVKSIVELQYLLNYRPDYVVFGVWIELAVSQSAVLTG